MPHPLPMLFALLAFAPALALAGPKMTLEQARKAIIKHDLPAFWVGDAASLDGRLAQLKTGTVMTIAKSPGGRPLYLVAYGERETVRHVANYNSAIGGEDASAYMDKKARKKPVLLFVGPVHGQEVEGMTGLVNLIQVMETGKDLRGKDQSELRALGRRCRLLIIPCANPDGNARFEPRTCMGMTVDELNFWGQGTWAGDTIADWPVSKRQHPWAGPSVKVKGCYFDDLGVNPMHDEFFAPMSTEAPAILRVAREEGPDYATSLHGHGSPPALLRPAWVSLEVQADVAQLAESCYALCDQRALPHAKSFTPAPEQGPKPAAFNLIGALHHTSGAAAFTFECPHGLNGPKYARVTFESILDIQLTLYESMLRHALQ